MRILEVAPLVAPIDDRGEQLGGAQILLADLAGGLAKRGHWVVMAAARGSWVRGVTMADLAIDSRNLRPADLGARGPRADGHGQRAAFAAVRAWIDGHPEIDVVHAHAFDAPAFDLLSGSGRPVVHTLHLPPLDPGVVAAARRAGDARFVTVSRANAAAWRASGVEVDTVILNGLDLGAIRFNPGSGRYLLHAGRISPEKGVEQAIGVAARLGWNLLLVGGIYDERYYRETVRPLVRSSPGWRIGEPFEGVLHIGRRRRAEVYELMGAAAALLMPVRWEEPFGLVALEALAAGTPVVAYRRGGLPEVVDETCGALVAPDDERAFADGVLRALELSRSACRARAERFGLEPMITAYEAELGRSIV